MTTTTENDHDDDDDDDAGQQPRVTDAPMEIWLQYGDDLLVDTPHSALARDGEVTWCDSQVFPFDVKYIRADEIDRLRERWADAEARNVTLATVQRERDELRSRVAEFDALRQKAAAIDKLARSMVRDWGRRDEAGYRFPDTVPLIISTRDACAPDDLVRQILGWADEDA